LPNLKIRTGSLGDEDICELVQAKSRLNFDGGVILAEGRRVRSYEELVRLATQDYSEKEFIDVVLLPLIAGG
jgi:hypothetical protein